MIWTLETIESVLELYKEHNVLWDPKDPSHLDKLAREEAFQQIADELDLPISGKDIHRKLKTMRAAYQVELRNISTANLRGFFYKPTLKWFGVYKNIMGEVDHLKVRLVFLQFFAKFLLRMFLINLYLFFSFSRQE
jgi:hypothetical protein